MIRQHAHQAVSGRAVHSLICLENAERGYAFICSHVILCCCATLQAYGACVLSEYNFDFVVTNAAVNNDVVLHTGSPADPALQVITEQGFKDLSLWHPLKQYGMPDGFGENFVCMGPTTIARPIVYAPPCTTMMEIGPALDVLSAGAGGVSMIYHCIIVDRAMQAHACPPQVACCEADP